MISNISNTGGFTTTLTDNGDTLTLGFNGNYPSQQANGEITYNVTFTAVASPSYISAIGFTLVNAGYSISSSIIYVGSSDTEESHDMNSTTITASAGNFTSAPPVFYANETATGDNYIKVTSHNKPSSTDAEASNPFYITTTNPTSTTIAITGKAWVAVGDTSGYGNIALVPEDVTIKVTSITVGGVQKNTTSSSHTHLSVNGIETPVTFAVAANGAINYSLANVSLGSGVSASVSSSTSTGSATVTVAIASGASSGSFDFIATPTGGTAWTVTVTHTKSTLILNEMHRLKMSDSSYSTKELACSGSFGTTYSFYATTSDNNIGDRLYASDEAAYGGVGDQSGYFVGDGGWYKVHRQYWPTNAYIDLGSTSYAWKIATDGEILDKHVCS